MLFISTVNVPSVRFSPSKEMLPALIAIVPSWNSFVILLPFQMIIPSEMAVVWACSPSAKNRDAPRAIRFLFLMCVYLIFML